MNLFKQPLILPQNYMKMRIGSEYRKNDMKTHLYNPVLLDTFDIVSLISNTSRKYKIFLFQTFQKLYNVFISEIVIQNLLVLEISETMKTRLSQLH